MLGETPFERRFEERFNPKFGLCTGRIGPQDSRESTVEYRILGKQNARSILENYPGVLPNMTDHSYVLSGNLSVMKMTLEYDGNRVYDCKVIDFQDGKIERVRAYFGEPFEAPEWRRSGSTDGSLDAPLSGLGDVYGIGPRLWARSAGPHEWERCAKWGMRRSLGRCYCSCPGQPSISLSASEWPGDYRAGCTFLVTPPEPARLTTTS